MRLRPSAVMAPEAPPTATEPVRRPVGRPRRIKTTKLAEIPVRVGGEPFLMRALKRRVLLTHERWSLIGAGPTLGAAEIALRREAAAIVRVYGAIPPETLDADAAALLVFALRVAAE